MPRQRLEVLEDYVVHDYVVEESLVDVDVDGGVATVLHRDRMSATVLAPPRAQVTRLAERCMPSD